jgi:uncharacterized protein
LLLADHGVQATRLTLVDVSVKVSPITAAWRAVGLFVLLTACLSGIFWALVNATQTVNAAYIFGLMWMPAVAAILTCRILGRPLRTLGLGTCNGRYVLIGYLIPIIYCLVASLGIWIFGFGGFPNAEFVGETADAFGLSGAPEWLVIAMFVVLTGTTGMLSGVAAATGEEIGWRGFWFRSWPRCCRSPVSHGLRPGLGVMALPDHRRRLPQRRPSAVVLAADLHVRRSRDQLREAWLRPKTDSLWPPIFLHASHNLWMQSIFTPLTSDRE